VRQLTDRINSELGEVTIQAEQAEALRLIERAQRIFSAAGGEEDSLSQGFELKRSFVDGYHQLLATHTRQLQAVQQRIERYERDLDRLGLDPDHLSPSDFTLARSLRYALKSVAALTILLPMATLGAVVHLPAYKLTHALSLRLSKGEDDMTSTIKILAGLLFYPLTWGLSVAICVWVWGWVGLLALAVAPLSALAALHFMERSENVLGAARGLALFVTRRSVFESLDGERKAIRAQILELSEELDTGG